MIRAGKLSELGLIDDRHADALAKILEQVEKTGIETVRVLFADQHGILRGKTIVANALGSVFANGMRVPATLLLKDTSHRTVFPIWDSDDGKMGSSGGDPLKGAGDILLLPQAETFRLLPFSPHSAWIFCDLHYKDGTEIGFSSRRILGEEIRRLATQNLEMRVGLEVEFHVLELDDPMLNHAHATMPGTAPKTRNLNQGFRFLTASRYGEAETLLDVLRRHCIEMKLPVRSMEIEMGPSQFEFTFDPAPPLEHADNMMMFRALLKETCFQRGLIATFMAKPKIENCAASGWHLHQSLLDTRTGENKFAGKAKNALTPTASAWIAGLLDNARASCLLTTPTVNGYKRFQPFQLAPDRIQWGSDNRGAMLRALLESDDPASRIENRIAEPAANPYLALASQITSGLDGLERNLEAPPPCERPYDPGAEPLPLDLKEAIDCFDGSPLYRAAFGDDVVDYLVTIKQAEWQRYQSRISQWEQDEYFTLF